MIIEKLRKVVVHLSEDGIIKTMRWLYTSTVYYPVTRWLDNSFDRKYGTDTTQKVHVNEFDIDSELINHATAYMPTPDRKFMQLIGKQDINLSDYNFVDLGCGKGKALLLASQHPFKRILGVEIEPQVYSVCKSNIETFLKNTGGKSIEVFQMSAGDFEFPPGNIFLYLYNPFDAHIMQQVASQLCKAAQSESRTIRIMYLHPNHVGPLLSIPNIKTVSEETFRSRDVLNNHNHVINFEIPPVEA